jgi:hypothetical protein
MTGAGRRGGEGAAVAGAVAAMAAVAGAVAAGAVAAVAGCGSAASPSPPGAQLAQALEAALEAAQAHRVPWRCAAPDGPTLAEETLAAGKRSWKLGGGTMRLAGEGAVAIGVVADAGGAAPRTLAALGALRKRLAGADLVLVLGGMGATQAELEATLGALAEGTAPVVAVPGDLEPAGDQAAAIARLRAQGRAVIDGRLARWLELPGATIATIPGAGAAARLVAGAEGCGYRAADVTAVLEALTKRDGLRILASAEAPRIEVDGEPAGELALTVGAPHAIDVALHGPTAEGATRERAGRRDGAAAALTPGSSDATTRLPGPRRAASAGVLHVERNGWRWRPIEAPGD